MLISLTFAFGVCIASTTDPSIPTPTSVLGKEPGSDFFLANYDQSLAYFRALDAASDRVMLKQVGKSTFGQDWYIALISSKENLARIDEIVEISRKLAEVDGLDDAAAHELAKKGRAIVHIDGGLHAGEVACAQHTIPLAYRLAATQGDATIDRILNECVLELWFSINPDGQNMIVDWYDQNLGTPFEVSPMPWLYQKYIGHDNNRDGYMNNMLESQVVTRTTLELCPVVFYNHHQTAPFPARIWIPPFAEPVSSNVHPLMWRWMNVFGTGMAAWLDEHQMTGAIHRGTGFDDWYPGFIDHVNSFRNTVSFLTETALYEYATPKFYEVSDFPRDRRDLHQEALYASPWRGGWWHLSDAVHYMIEASMAVLDTAARYRENLLFNRYRAGRDQIQRFRTEPPFAYVIPQRQFDPGTAATLVDKLLGNGIRVMRATKAFRANGREYAAGDTVVLLDQPYGALVKELFETQEYPEIKEGDKLDLPYDVVGWTLPLQFGVDAQAVLAPPTPAMRESLTPVATAPRPEIPAPGDGPVWRLAHRSSDATRAINDVLKAGAHVVLDPAESTTDGFVERGAYYVYDIDKNALASIAARRHVVAESVAAPPPNSRALQRPRVALYHPWQPSIDEGWTRWVLEEFGFEPILLLNDDVRAGHLKDRYDAIVLSDISARSIREGFATGTIPARYAGGIESDGVDRMREFVKDGGTLLAFNDSARFAVSEFALKVKDVAADWKQEEFFCSGSLLLTEIAACEDSVAYGVLPESTISFSSSPVFETQEGFAGSVLLRYPKDRPLLRSGFLRGNDKLAGKAALVAANYGKGTIYLYGFRPQWRGQPFGTFRLIFNAIYASTLAPAQHT